MGDHEAKRAELLAATISVIAREGYAGASIRNVAKQAGYSTGAVTYYFANKEAMVTAAAHSLWDEFDTLLDTRKERVDIKAGIRQWLDWTNVNEPDKWLALFQLMVHARHEPAFATIFQQRYARFRQVLASIVEKGQSQGVIRRDISADLLADQISAISDGWMMSLPIDPERFKGSRRQALLDAVVTLISPPASARD